MDRRHIGESSAPIPIKAFDFFYSGFVVPLSEGVPEKIAATQLWKEFFSGTSAYSPRVVVFTYAILVSVTAAALLCSYRFYRRTEKDEISKIILMFLAFQFVLHMVYGHDPFLYSYHFLPMIILFVALQAPKNLFSVAAIIACSWALQQIRAEQSERFIRFFG
jgi:small neutral amino acid transporter SnatA (MarC family)